MLLALLIYLGANTGAIVATPVIINSLAISSVITESHAYYQGRGK